MVQNPIVVKSTLIKVMAWCPQAISHYLSRRWLRFMSLYGIINEIKHKSVYTHDIIPVAPLWYGGVLFQMQCSIVLTLDELGPLSLTWFNLNPAWISNHMPRKLLDDIIYPFSIFLVCEWICNFVRHFKRGVITYSMLVLTLIHVSKSDPWEYVWATFVTR